MGAAVRRRDGVAIGRDEAVIAAEPGDRPFDRAMAAGLRHLAGKDLVRHAWPALETLIEEILEAAREMQHRLFRRLLVLDMGGITGPADLDAAEQIGFGTRHAEKPRARELDRLAEDLRIRPEADAGAAPVVDLAELLELARRL